MKPTRLHSYHPHNLKQSNIEIDPGRDHENRTEKHLLVSRNPRGGTKYKEHVAIFVLYHG